MLETGTRVRATRTLPASTRLTQPPLVTRVRTRVTVLERSDEWPRFVLVRTAHGEVGWVPERTLGAERPTTHVRRPYDTAVLGPSIGELLEVVDVDQEAGWFWGRDADGATGWFPVEFVDPA